MAKNIRAENLGVIRYLNLTHKSFSKKLENITNSAYLSEMIDGSREVSNSVAREIESVLLLLPDDWMDRDNLSLIHMSKLDFELMRLILVQSTQAKQGLVDFIANKNLES
ncbi:MAG: hypothetical protein BVN34_04275 [Proteobacteria bacterium ST_bin12]|nr:MAG: hypothetical protein BVN34_04275 [Proteobacteria bacterium ST_bin12]